jgi:hypothetical protein
MPKHQQSTKLPISDGSTGAWILVRRESYPHGFGWRLNALRPVGDGRHLARYFCFFCATWYLAVRWPLTTRAVESIRPSVLWSAN